jgi:hypothetical protein
VGVLEVNYVSKYTVVKYMSGYYVRLYCNCLWTITVGMSLYVVKCGRKNKVQASTVSLSIGI